MAGQQWGMLYAENGGATDIATDASDPNTVAPSAARIFRQHLQPGGSVGMDHALRVFVGNGTSLEVEVWILDETSSVTLWWKLGTTTVTAAAGSASFAAIPGAKTFVRVVTNTGNVKRYAVSQS